MSHRQDDLRGWLDVQSRLMRPCEAELTVGAWTVTNQPRAGSTTMEMTATGLRWRSGVTATPPTTPLVRALLSAAAVAILAGCGSTTATTSSPSPSAMPSSTPDVAVARAAAMNIIVPLPGTPGVWAGCAQVASDLGACPFAPAIIARLKYLSGTGYFGDAPPSGVCGEDYITGTQNGLFVAPQILTATANADGSVTVVIKRGLPPPNLTAAMTLANGIWLASDLASGTGPMASILSAKPNC